MLDDQLSVLSNAHRRRTLLALLEDDLQDDRTVASDGSDADGEGQRAIAMEHVHLPRLEDHGYIDRNREEYSVTKGAQFDEIEPLLAILKGIEEEKAEVGSFD